MSDFSIHTRFTSGLSRNTATRRSVLCALLVLGCGPDADDDHGSEIGALSEPSSDHRAPVGIRTVAIATLSTIAAATEGALTAENLTTTDHEIEIGVAGATITTRIDGHEVDRRTLTEPDQLRASGTIGFAAGSSGVIRDVTVEAPGQRTFSTSFANHANPFEAGVPVAAGGIELVNGNVMLPIANPAPLVRTSFRTRSAPIARARLYVTGGGYPVVSINGDRVTTDGKPASQPGAANIPRLVPDHTNHDRTVLYNTFDVTQLVSAGGENVIAAELGRGWYGVTVPGEWYWNMANYHGNPRIRARLVITCAHGDPQIIATRADTWKSADGPTTFDSVYTGEKYDARIAASLGDWQRRGYDDRAWSRATRMNPPGSCPQGGCVGSLPDTGAVPAGFVPARLRAQENEPVHVREVLHAVGIVESAPGSRVYIFEMGNDRSQLVAGWARLTLADVTPDKAGLTIRLRQDESRTGTGTLDAPYAVSEANRFTDGNFQTDYYTLSAAPTQSWAAKFRYGGVRFIEVRGLFEVLGRAPDLARDRDLLTVEAAGSGGAPAGTFSSDNALLERIMRNASYAQRNNNVHKPNDTPSREKNGWTGDGWADAEANLLNNDIVRFFIKWGRDFPDSVISTGEWSEIVPAVKGGYGYDGTPGWSFLFGPTPAWDAAFFFIPWELYLYTGETNLLRELYPAQKRFMDYYAARFQPPGYVFSNAGATLLGDYQSQGPSGGVEVINMQLYYYFADYMAKVGALLGRADDAATYRDLADGVLTSFLGRYWDPAGQRFTGGGPSTQNVMAIAFGMVPGSDLSGPLHLPGPTQADNLRAVAGAVAATIAAASNHLQGGIYGLRSLYNVLADHGYIDLSYLMVTQVTAPSWGDLINRGNTALTESWNAGTGNHHYFSSVMTWYYQDILGIRPTAPGYRTVRIKPYIPAVAGTSSVPPFTPENPEVASSLDRASGSLRTVRGVIGSAWARKADGRIRLQVTLPSNTPTEVWVPTRGQPVAPPAGARLTRVHGTGTTSYAVFTVGPGSHIFNP